MVCAPDSTSAQHGPGDQLALAFVLDLQDVSTVMELCRRWFPAEYNKAPWKRNAHTALSDIQDSIRQLRHYRCS